MFESFFQLGYWESEFLGKLGGSGVVFVIFFGLVSYFGYCYYKVFEVQRVECILLQRLERGIIELKDDYRVGVCYYRDWKGE